MNINMFHYLVKHRCVDIFPVSDIDQGVKAETHRKAFFHRIGSGRQTVGKRSGALLVCIDDLLRGDRVGEDHAVTWADLIVEVFAERLGADLDRESFMHFREFGPAGDISGQDIKCDQVGVIRNTEIDRML